MASAAQVSKYATYAESGLNNSKALDDCKAFPGTCKSVYYFDPNDVYNSVLCPYAPDASIISAASEDWYVHQAGFTDAGHRVNGVISQDCQGSTVSVPVWTTNDGSSNVQAWWNNELQSNADQFDVGFMDDTQSRVVDQYYYRSGGGCLPWPSLCSTTQEVPDDLAVRAGHASFANAVTHRDGSPWQLVFNSLNFDGQQVSPGLQLFAASPHFIGGVCEGCAISNGRVQSSNYSRILNTMNAINAISAIFILHSTDSAPSGGSSQIFEREVTTGLIWLGYSQGHTVVWPDLEDTSPSLAIWPEDLIYPASPVQTMVSGAADLQVAPGVWRREFKTCYQSGVFFGRCAAVVNSNGSSVSILKSWLSQSYAHTVMFQGGDQISGGSANVTGGTFQAGVTTVSAGGAVLLAQ